MITPQTERAIAKLVDELTAKFTPPEFIPGCKVQSIADKDQYASNNGWIEATCGRHNQQRCRWRGQIPSIAVNDYIDVIYYPSYAVFIVAGQGGSGASSLDLAADGSVDSTGEQDFTAGIKTDAITESSAAAGVTVDGVLLKDGDVFVTSDNYGLANRVINYGVSPTDHFRGGVIPAGYNWISDADFDGTPGLVTYSVYGGDHMRAAVTTAGYKHFLAKSTTPGGNILLYGKFSTGITTEMGLRIDDGSNTTFGEIYVTGAPANGTIRVDWRTASGTTSTALIVPAGKMITLGLIYNHSAGTITGYIYTDYGSTSNITGASVSSGVLGSARSGIFVGANGGNPAVCDWFYSSV